MSGKSLVEIDQFSDWLCQQANLNCIHSKTFSLRLGLTWPNYCWIFQSLPISVIYLHPICCVGYLETQTHTHTKPFTIHIFSCDFLSKTQLKSRSDQWYSERSILFLFRMSPILSANGFNQVLSLFCCCTN